MSFQTPISVSDAIYRIQSRTLLLPAIQREFVWEPGKVEWLFDSLLQGYPIGSFLFDSAATGSMVNPAVATTAPPMTLNISRR
jgi:uncharacterized protein with ParB-like and HNH nuclease domain